MDPSSCVHKDPKHRMDEMEEEDSIYFILAAGATYLFEIHLYIIQ